MASPAFYHTHVQGCAQDPTQTTIACEAVHKFSEVIKNIQTTSAFHSTWKNKLNTIIPLLFWYINTKKQT